MEDRELLELELAAKAADYVIRWYDDTLAYGPTFGIEVEPGNPSGFEPWNPLDDDGDALRLAVAMCLPLDITDEDTLVAPLGIIEPHGDDPLAATRRAIVRAAAEIGRAMS